MELPFLKNKDKQGAGMTQVAKTSEDSDEQAILDGVAQEFIDAVHKKDIKAMREALSALVSHIQYQDQMQDEESK